eukprot:7500268-Alexandrium_andersonii.AAC.1
MLARRPGPGLQVGAAFRPSALNRRAESWHDPLSPGLAAGAPQNPPGPLPQPRAHAARGAPALALEHVAHG